MFSGISNENEALNGSSALQSGWMIHLNSDCLFLDPIFFLNLKVQVRTISIPVGIRIVSGFKWTVPI